MLQVPIHSATLFCGQSPALLDPIRCATMHRNGSGTSVKRYPQPTDLIWMPAGSLRQLSVHQVQPAGVVFRDSDGPKAFRIRRTGPAAPGKGGGRSRTTVNHIPNPWFNSSSRNSVSVTFVEARYLESEIFRKFFVIFPTI